MEEAELERENQMKINLFMQKRVTLEHQIDSLRSIITEEGVDIESLKLRGADVRELFMNYLEYNNELILLDEDGDHKEILTQIQNNYYDVMAQVILKTQPIINTVDNNENPPSASISQQQVELPEIPLPKFNGKYEEWFIFKDAFIAIVDTNTEINEVSKLFVLKNCLIDDAQGKLDMYREIPGEYARAWKHLEKVYEIKRIIVESHLRAIDKLPFLKKESTEGLTKLVDGLLQHRTFLERLGIEIHPTVAVHMLQSRLPKCTLQKWNESINLEELPSLDSLVEFIYRMAVCASRNNQRPNLNNSEQQRPKSKKMRYNNQRPAHQVSKSNASFNCPACKKEKHPLFLCVDFNRRTLKEKYNIIKRANNICINCLRFHKNECNYSGCKKCGEKHNTLLHPRKPNKVAIKAEVKEENLIVVV